METTADVTDAPVGSGDVAGGGGHGRAVAEAAARRTRTAAFGNLDLGILAAAAIAGVRGAALRRPMQSSLRLPVPAPVGSLDRSPTTWPRLSLVGFSGFASESPQRSQGSGFGRMGTRGMDLSRTAIARANPLQPETAALSRVWIARRSPAPSARRRRAAPSRQSLSGRDAAASRSALASEAWAGCP